MEKLKTVVANSQQVLGRSKAIFPFDMFPDSITVDRQKLTVVHRAFFNIEQTVSVEHKDIKNVTADVGPIFGSLTITSEHFANNTQTIKYLPKKEVREIQRLVQGFISAYKEKIDMSGIEETELVALLDELGKGEPT